MSALEKYGFQIIDNVFSIKEVDDILTLINSSSIKNEFGVREFLLDNPEIFKKVFTRKLIAIIKNISPNCNKLIKSIYFDKPPNANWVVNWHQDLTINLIDKKEIPNFRNWRVQSERTIVQPDRAFLESIFTIRIHLDDCTETNGALRIIEASHQLGVVKMKDWIKQKEGVEKICEVQKGGILIMKPLTLHSSRRSENQRNRRIIHLEFTDKELPDGLNWKEKIEFDHQ